MKMGTRRNFNIYVEIETVYIGHRVHLPQYYIEDNKQKNIRRFFSMRTKIRRNPSERRDGRRTMDERRLDGGAIKDGAVEWSAVKTAKSYLNSR
jgi:hypothetical protein